MRRAVLPGLKHADAVGGLVAAAQRVLSAWERVGISPQPFAASLYGARSRHGVGERRMAILKGSLHESDQIVRDVRTKIELMPQEATASFATA